MKSFRSHRKSIERTKLKEDLSDEGILENPDDLDILEHAGFVEVQSQPTVPHFVGTKSNITTEAVNYKTYDDITLNQLNDIEKYADKLFAKVGIDVEFTRHFLDRVNDARNKRQITPAELTRLFKQSYKKHGRTISKLGPAAQAVINDMRTDINMPFVLEPKGNVLELVAKTVMRKKDFKTPNTKFSFEQYIKEKHDFFEKDIYEKITLPPPPRNDYREIQKIKDAISTRTAADEESIRLHDEVPFHAIQEYCEKENLQFHIGEFEQLADQSAEVIMHFKEKFNRKRPWLVDESIRPLNSKTNKTPAYPSGHAAQSILIANYVAGKFPEHRVGLMAAAKKCGWGRVQAGWHYVSDYKVGNQLGEELYKLMNRASFFSEDALKFDEQLRGLSEDIRIESERDKIAQKEKDVIQSLIEVNEAFNETEEVVVDLIQDPFLRWQEPIEPDPNSPQDVAGHITGEGHILPEELTVVQALSEELGQLKRSLPNMMATTAGGGSVNLFDLDDVDESTRQDGYFLQYRSSDSKYIGAASAVSEETIADVVGSMVTSNTESGITVTYQDGDNTLDFTIGTLNQDTTGNAATATALETARTIHGVSFDGTANIDLTEVVQDTVGAMFSSNTETGIAVSYEDGDGTIDLVVGTLNQNTTGNAATATLATTVTVSDSTANTNFPVVFHNESNALLDDTGALRYNPSTGELLVPKLTVAGTTTQVDTVTMEASNAIVFEGATADAYETTLTVTDPTADRTITLPNVTGTVALTSSDITGNAATATALETARTIGMTGDVVWTSASFDGSGNVTGSATIQANSVDGTMIALGSDAAGDVMYYDGTNYIRLAKGSDDEVLTLASGVPSWATSSAGGATSINGLSDALVENNSIWLGSSPTASTDTANKNVAVGTTALDAVTTGDENTALGWNALTALTTGTTNVAVGSDSLIAATTANYNTALGNYSGMGLITGTHSTFIGWSAGSGYGGAPGIADPSYNTSVGSYSQWGGGGDPASGAGNSSLGYSSLKVIDTGYNNVAIGYNTGLAITTGHSHTLVGKSAGDAITTGSNNTVIGYNAAASAVDVSNEITFGDANIDTVRFPQDGTAFKFGADGDVTLTHVADTGLLLNSTRQIQFGDSGTYIHQSADGVLDLVSDTELELNATTIDINGNVEISGTAAITGVATFSATPVFPDGSIAVADLDIDGATDIGAAIVDADLFIIDDGAGGTNRKTTASRIKTYVADVTLTTAAQTNITSLGTLTALQVDNININGNTISSTAGTDLLITPLAGQQIVLDGTIVVDAGVVTGATSITSTAFVGALTGNVTGNVSGSSGSATGNAATATALATARTIGGTSFDGTGNIAVALSATATALASARTIGGVSFDGTANINLPGVNAAGNQNTSGTAAIATTVTITDNESTNESNAIIFTAGGDVDGGNLGLESDGTLTYNPSTGKVTATGFVGTLTGNVTGNTSGSSGSTTGNAATATALATGRTIAMTGDVTWTSASFDGSGNVTGTAAIGSGVIVDADVNASAAIAWSKMANLTASRALYSDGSGDVTVSAVTSTELGYLDGVTSALQTQLDAKGALAGMTMTGTTKHGDMVKSMWGTGDDFEIFHDQYNTYLHDTGTGAILVGTSEFQIKNAAYDETMFVATADGAVTLYHNNNARLATSGAGVTVTGTVTATAGATLLVKNSSGTTLKTIKGMS